MAKSNTQVVYDYDDDLLFLSRNRPVKASIEIGGFVLDIDKKGFISALEILDASKNLGVSKSKLSALTGASMVVNYKPDSAIVLFYLKFEDHEEKITVPISLGLGHADVQKKETFVTATL